MNGRTTKISPTAKEHRSNEMLAYKIGSNVVNHYWMEAKVRI